MFEADTIVDACVVYEPIDSAKLSSHILHGTAGVPTVGSSRLRRLHFGSLSDAIQPASLESLFRRDRKLLERPVPSRTSEQPPLLCRWRRQLPG